MVLNIVDLDECENEGNSQMLLISLPSGHVVLLGAFLIRRRCLTYHTARASGLVL